MNQSGEADTQQALDIVYNNTDFTEDELVGVVMVTEGDERFYNVNFFRGVTYYTYFVRESDGKFFTYEEFSEAYPGNDTSSQIDTSSQDDFSNQITSEQQALDIVYNATNYTEDELVGISTNEDDGDTFYNIAFMRNGTFVFFVRQREGKLYNYDEYNKAYNEDFEGYTGHD